MPRVRSMIRQIDLFPLHALRRHDEYGSGGFLSPSARLVALVQTSSASVKCVFSQVKFIVNAISVNALEDTIETRLMCLVNEY